jgi:hypothetical protein
VTDQPYTDDDLRAEAAGQHRVLLSDPDFMGIGEQMDGSEIESTFHDEAGQRHDNGRTWDQLSREDFDDAQRRIDALLEAAADVSEWAVNLGADGLEPEEHQFTLSAGPKPIIRVHFAFAPEMSDEARTAFVEGLGAAAAREMQLALNGQ